MIKAISFKNELEKSFPQKFADHCSQQIFVYQIRAIYYLKGNINMLQTETEQPIVIHIIIKQKIDPYLLFL